LSVSYWDEQIKDADTHEARVVFGRSARVILIQTPEGKIPQKGT